MPSQPIGAAVVVVTSVVAGSDATVVVEASVDVGVSAAVEVTVVGVESEESVELHPSNENAKRIGRTTIRRIVRG